MPILTKSLNTRSSSRRKLFNPSKSSITTQQSTLIKPSNTTRQSTSSDSSSEICVVSTPPESTSIATRKDQPNPLSSPDWPIFDKDDNTLPRGLPFFGARKSNILNFQQE